MRRRRLGVAAVAGLVIVLLAAACDFNGTWTAVSVPVPSGAASADDLHTLSCLPSGQCIAAGTTAELRTGSTWSDIASPPEPVDGLACTSTTDCLATASIYGDGLTVGAVYHYDGSGWTATDWAGSRANAVSCASSTMCMAVGDATDPVIERWDGAHMTATTVGDNEGYVADVSCPTTTFCLAVGQADDGTAWAAQWTGGSSWSSVPTSNLKFAPKHVSCGSPTFCETTDGSGDYQIGTWNGTSLVGGSAVTSSPDEAAYDTVSCPSTSADDCQLSSFTYDYVNFNWVYTGDVHRQGGGVSDLQTGGALDRVVCTSATSCEALGQGGTNNGHAAWHFDGTSWTADTFPTVHADTQVDSLSCTATTFCMMGGTYAYGKDRRAYLRRWNGSTWASAPSLPGDTTAVDLQVGCLSTTRCVAVRANGNNSGLYSWNGTSWTQLASAAFAGGSAIGCTGASFCMIVAFAQYWTWDGTTLSSVKPYSSSSYPTSVSCSSPTHCALLDNASTNSELFGWSSGLHIWDGTSWSAGVNIDNPPGSPQLTSVSCPPSGRCRAVGAIGVAGSPTGTPYVIEGDGTSWSPVTIPATGPGWLTSVSCPNSGECIAVGNATVNGTTDPQLSLGESAGTWNQAPDTPMSAGVPVAYNLVTCLPRWCMTVGAHTDNAHPTVTSADYSWTESSS
jgi:hypothetical protein